MDVSDAASGMGTGRVRPSVRVGFSVWGVPAACVNFKARWWWGDDAGTVAVEVTRLLHFGEFEVEQAVDPVEELRASHEERGMLEPDGRRVRRSHRRDLDSGGDGARWFAVRACDAGFGDDDDDDARARCSRVETVEERRWWYSASRAGFWRVLGRVSLLSMSAPAVGSPEKKSLNSTLCPAATERPFWLLLQKMHILTVQTVSDFFFRILTVQTVSDVIPGGFGFRSHQEPIKTAPRTNPNRMTSAKTWS